ncbi:hypothetical protein AX777_16400 [Sphingobium yanoikuyae]|jgi:hypothetical protein|uniref:Uncharacterized protein n=1 Tax=Sphingobium yanoikuyae TaxID=13690 RepID=A0A177K3W7_SPHYA|nr:hypothetical protein AX777_16400 [Sphingobium yanoikuyae]
MGKKGVPPPPDRHRRRGDPPRKPGRITPNMIGKQRDWALCPARSGLGKPVGRDMIAMRLAMIGYSDRIDPAPADESSKAISVTYKGFAIGRVGVSIAPPHPYLRDRGGFDPTKGVTGFPAPGHRNARRTFRM